MAASGAMRAADGAVAHRIVRDAAADERIDALVVLAGASSGVVARRERNRHCKVGRVASRDMSRHLRHLGCPHRARGQTLVEFALTFPLFLVVLFGIIEFAFLFNAQLSLNYATRDASLVDS